MTDIMYKLAKVLHSSMIPLAALTMFNGAQKITGKTINSDNKSDEVPGDNYPFAVMSHYSGKERI